jgi:rod shape determining protein RodA
MSNAGLFHRPPPGLVERVGLLNWPLLVALGAIAAVGLAALYSVAGGSWAPWAERHALRFVIGLAVLIVIAVVPLAFWMQIAFPAYAVALFALALVPIIGSEALGARRWLQAGPLSFQPSEVMKIALALALARYCHGLSPAQLSNPLRLAIPIMLIAAPMALTLKQPDLGTALVIGLIGGGMLVMAGLNFAYLIVGSATLAVSIPLLLPLLHDYQRRRIEVFLDPTSDPLGAGYHVTQSVIAMGSGGVTGKGYLAGSQGQLDFLPEKHTDFIFTTIAEEWGLVGSVSVLLLFGVLLALLLWMAMVVKSRAGRLLICGSATMIFLHAAVNIGMVSGSLPVVGIPLPFISYGGTSMIVHMVSLGLSMCAWVHRHERL